MKNLFTRPELDTLPSSYNFPSTVPAPSIRKRAEVNEEYDLLRIARGRLLRFKSRLKA